MSNPQHPPYTRGRPSTWDDPLLVEELTNLWENTNYSAKTIAEMLGHDLTSNAVIGKAHRLGLRPRQSPIKRPFERIERKSPVKKEVHLFQRPDAYKGRTY